MELFDIDLKAGEQQQTTIKGRFFRMLSGKDRIKLETSNGVNGQVITGIGLDLRNESGAGFDWLRFTSATDQTITVLVSDMPTTDSRLSGEVDVNGLLQVLNKGGTRWNSATVELDSAAPGQELLGQDDERINASIQADTDMYIGATAGVTSATGIKIAAGQTVAVENSAALYVTVLNNGTARVMESLV